MAEDHNQDGNTLSRAEESFSKGLSSIEEFKSSNLKKDLDVAMVHVQRAIDILSDSGSPPNGGYIGMLGILYRRCFTLGDQLEDLDLSVKFLNLGLEFTSTDHPRRGLRHIHLAYSQTARSERLWDLDDIEAAIVNLGRALEFEIACGNEYHRGVALGELGICQHLRFRQQGKPKDLESSISNLQEALLFVGQDAPETDLYLRSLAAISNLKQTLTRVSDDNSTALKVLDRQGWVYADRYRVIGNPDDLEKSVTPELMKDDKSHFADHLGSLGFAQICSFQDSRAVEDVDGAIQNFQKAADLLGGKHIDSALHLNNLANALMSRFDLYAHLEDLDASISNHKLALSLVSQSHPLKALYLGGLGSAQTRRFGRLRELKDVDESILLLQEALKLMDAGHMDSRILRAREIYLSDLGVCHMRRFDLLGTREDIEASIANFQTSLQLCRAEPSGTYSIASKLNSLSHAKMRRFELLKEPEDIDVSILNWRETLDLLGEKHPDGSCEDLCSAIQRRYEILDNIEDCDSFISNLETSVERLSQSDNQLTLLSCQTVLAQARIRRYQMAGRTSDLHICFSIIDKTVDLMTEREDSDAPDLFHFISGMRKTKYWLHSDLDALDDSISRTQQLADLACSSGDPKSPTYLTELSNAQRMRFKELKQTDDIDASICNLQKALELMDDGHPSRPSCHNDLGQAYSERFHHSEDAKDRDAAILHLQKGIDTTTDLAGDSYALRELATFAFDLRDMEGLKNAALALEGTVSSFRSNAALDSRRSTAEMNLAYTYLLFHILTGDLDQARAAASSAKNAALTLPIRYPEVEFHMSHIWATMARKVDLQSALEGFRRCMELLPELAWHGGDVKHRRGTLDRMRIENTSSDAAACAIKLRRYEDAVEFFDVGRSICWQQFSALRDKFHELREKHGGLAAELEHLGTQLEGVTWEDYVTPSGRHQSEDFRMQRALLAEAWDDILRRIRNLGGDFEQFLRPATFKTLRGAATAECAIIIINISSEWGCVDALIVDAEEPVRHVPLPNIDSKTVLDIVKKIAARPPSEASFEEHQEYITLGLESPLRKIWNDVIMPIFKELQILLVPNLPAHQRRICWCLGGPLAAIPFHAAGPFDGKDDVDVSRLVISSYTACLGSLLNARNKIRIPIVKHKLLVVDQYNTPGEKKLPKAEEEVLQVLQAAKNVGYTQESITHLSRKDATVDAVSRAFDDCSCIHLSCHGVTDSMDSGFLLYDGDLTLPMVASKRIPNGRFAFLSACDTAADGSFNLPGEAMHLAAGMQFAGFPSVIGTLWSLVDADAPIVSRHVYQYLFRNGRKSINPEDVAIALNHAVAALRREGRRVTLDRWAAFIHMGV